MQVTPAEANSIRETIISGIEGWAEEFHSNGACKHWLQGADPGVRKVSETVNGPLLSKLAELTSHVDPGCVEFFRSGSPLYGLLAQSGIGEEKECSAPPDMEERWLNRARSNALLLESLREDEFSAELMELTEQDARLGRMTQPSIAESCYRSDKLLAPRFAVEQGVKSDGSVKIRAVDNFSWSCAPEDGAAKRSKKEVKGNVVVCVSPPSYYLCLPVFAAGDSINGHCGVQEKITHDHIDDLVRVMTLFQELLPGTPHLWKADVDSAFRYKLLGEFLLCCFDVVFAGVCR